MNAKRLAILAVLALGPTAAFAAKPMTADFQVVTGSSPGYRQSGGKAAVTAWATRTKASMSSHIRGLVRRANGQPVGVGHRGASYAEWAVALPQGASVRMIRAGQYHGQTESGGEFSMDGFDQDVDVTAVSQTSVHDLSSEADLDRRIAGDHVGIKFDGRLHSTALSGDAGEISFKLPHGTRTLEIVRYSGGQEVGGSSGYPLGRHFTLQWPEAKAAQ